MIEVTEEDVKAVMQVVCEVYKCKCDLKNQDCQCWEWAEPSDIIAAAWEVMRKKESLLFDKRRIEQSLQEVESGQACNLTQDDLAEAVKEALGDKPFVFIEFSKSAVGNAIVHVEATYGVAVRHISLDDNFPMLAAAAVRDLSKKVRQ